MNSTSLQSFPRRFMIGGFAFLSMVTLSSCAGLSDPSHEKESSYAKASDMDEGTIELQNWIPREATDVKIKFSTTAEARPITRFTLPGGQLPAQCEDAATAPSAPQLEAEWMPEDAASQATTLCGDFAVIADGSTITAWDTRAPEAS
ncbi:hypothetical protein [Arthrobacter ruber]|uniref:hypothetical protein n=1 Tax=Arthrobacter ruber TaxID=1258893 RepID=UPI000CF466A8|nr:hypothetical protein [Arthrobacter ruber]